MMEVCATIAHIIPTVGRASIEATLASIDRWLGDEVIVIQHHPPSGRFGNPERNEGIAKARADYLAFIDDDDVYVLGHRYLMDKAIRESSILRTSMSVSLRPVPILFKIQYPNGRQLWRKKWVKCGNVTGQMILVPNRKDMFTDNGAGYWDENHSWADFLFINCWKWPAKQIAWRTEVIQLLGHDDEKFELGLSHKELRQAQRERWRT